MGWRIIVISENAKLDYRLGCLIVRKKEVTKINLDEISILLIETTAVSLTSALLNELVKEKIKVIFCDEKRNPASELIPYYSSHDTSEKIRSQIKWSTKIKKIIWTKIVAEKILKQAQLLELLQKTESALLKKYIAELKFADKSNREGHAAKVYFNALFGKNFSRNSLNSINSSLNYGYSILLSAFNREVSANGYVTQLGLFHDNMFNPFNLSSDLMEPFRPLIDRRVYEMKPNKFEHEEKQKILNVLNETVFINNREEYINNAIKIYCKSVFNSLHNNSDFIDFYQYEF